MAGIQDSRAATFGRLFDGLVRRAHGTRIFGIDYHPYHYATDIGSVFVLGFAAWYCMRNPGVDFVRFALAFLAMQACYWLIRRWRKHRFGIASRSFVQDSLLIVLPSFALATVLLGNPFAASLDLAGLCLPLGLAFIRVGCFLGGCCYGRTASWGVSYPAECLVNRDGCRPYRSGPVPAGRVVPLQLFEAAFGVALFGALLLWHLSTPESAGRILPGFLLAYSIWRVASDRWRAVSARPRWAGATEAQWVCLLVIVGASLALLF